MPFVILALGIPFLIVFLIISGFMLAPVVATWAAARGAKWYRNRPASTAVLLERASRYPDPFPPTEWFAADFERWFFSGEKVPVKPLYDLIMAAVKTLYAAEGLDAPFPAPPSDRDRIAVAQYRDALITWAHRGGEAKAIIAAAHQALAQCFSELLRKLPPSCFVDKASLESGTQPFLTVPLSDMLRRPGQAVSDMTKAFNTAEADDYGLFKELRLQLMRNVHDMSGQREGAPEHKLVFPHAHPGAAPVIIKGYLQYTTLQYVFDARVPFPITPQRRVEHWHLIGGSGHGKTQTLQHVLMRDLEDPDAPALVVIDSQGEMLRKIQRLRIFADDPDRLIVIDPEHSPSLNMFAAPSGRMDGYSAIVREQVQAGVLELYSYVFGAISSELTAKQGTAFAFVVRLMLATPGATIHTLLQLMEDPAKDAGTSEFAEHIASLDHTGRAFFENQFFSKTAFGQTRQQIARRLYAVLSVPAFDRMFSARENKYDAFAAIQGRKVVLANTAKALLKADASALFGRFMIAQVMAAAFERIAVSPSERRPAYLVIDEAAEYFDDSLESLLSQARKYNLGVLFAHQHMEQLNPALRSSVASNTTIKMAGGVSDRDARMLDADMKTSNEFIGSMRKKLRSTEFAAYIRNETPTAVRLEIPFGTLEDAPRMSPDEHRDLIRRNKERLSSESAATQSAEKPQPDEKAAAPQGKEW